LVQELVKWEGYKYMAMLNVHRIEKFVSNEIEKLVSNEVEKLVSNEIEKLISNEMVRFQRHECS